MLEQAWVRRALRWCGYISILKNGWVNSWCHAKIIQVINGKIETLQTRVKSHATATTCISFKNWLDIFTHARTLMRKLFFLAFCPNVDLENKQIRTDRCLLAQLSACWPVPQNLPWFSNSITRIWVRGVCVTHMDLTCIPTKGGTTQLPSLTEIRKCGFFRVLTLCVGLGPKVWKSTSTLPYKELWLQQESSRNSKRPFLNQL